MLKVIFILLFAIVSYGQTASIETSNNVPDEKGSLEGRHGIDLILGLYDDTNITSITGTSVVTNASTGFMGFISYQYWFKNYLSFHNWATENGYTENLTIDRIDNDGDYCPENCQWVPKGHQGRNQRTTILTMEKAEEIRRLHK